MTPSGRLDHPAGGWGEPRPPGPTQELIPVGRGGRAPSGRVVASPSPESIPISLPKLDSPLVQMVNGNPQIPWQYLLINLWRLAQPTGVTPGTYGGISVNAHGQVIPPSQTSGATIDSPSLTGSPTAPTPAANDNSTAIATTAWVQQQGYLTSTGDVTQAITIGGDVTGTGQETGTIPTTVIRIQGRPVSAAAPAVGQAWIWTGSAWAPGQAGIPDAPADGRFYARQNNAWVAITATAAP